MFDLWLVVDFMNLLFNKGKLEFLGCMLLLVWDGLVMKMEGLLKIVDEYLKVFRKEVGGCVGEDLERLLDWFVVDLFCEVKKEEIVLVI